MSEYEIYAMITAKTIMVCFCAHVTAELAIVDCGLFVKSWYWPYVTMLASLNETNECNTVPLNKQYGKPKMV